MARFIVRCPNPRCRFEFVSNAINISESLNIRIKDRIESCQKCGYIISRKDTIYNLPDAEPEDVIDVRGGIALLFKGVEQPIPVARALAFELEELEARMRSSPASPPVPDTSAADASPHRDQVAEVRKGLFDRVFGKGFAQMETRDQIAILAEARQALESILKGAAKVATGVAILYGASKAPEVASSVASTITAGEHEVECVVGEQAPNREEGPHEAAERGEVVPRHQRSDEEHDRGAEQ